MEFKDFIGMTFIDIKGLEKDSEEVIFTTSDGRKFRMYHSQDCCESVWLEDIYGNIQNIIGEEITVADEKVSQDEGYRVGEYDESYTWTFYTIASKKGYVDIRWYGTSNGYYSESVGIDEIEG